MPSSEEVQTARQDESTTHRAATDGCHEHEGRFQKFGSPRAEPGDHPQRADGA